MRFAPEYVTYVLNENFEDAKALFLAPLMVLWNIFYWTYERATWQYDLMVIAILAFVWITPPPWLGDPIATGDGPVGWIGRVLSAGF